MINPKQVASELASLKAYAAKHSLMFHMLMYFPAAQMRQKPVVDSIVKDYVPPMEVSKEAYVVLVNAIGHLQSRGYMQNADDIDSPQMNTVFEWILRPLKKYEHNQSMTFEEVQGVLARYIDKRIARI